MPTGPIDAEVHFELRTIRYIAELHGNGRGAKKDDFAAGILCITDFLTPNQPHEYPSFLRVNRDHYHEFCTETNGLPRTIGAS
jgi:hypothetical protein